MRHATSGTRRLRLALAGTLLTAMVVSTGCAAEGDRGGDGAGDTGARGAATASHAGHGTPSAPSAPAPLRAGERFVNLTMPQPYTPAAPNGGTDEYRCFVVDPKLTRLGYLTGSQFLPQNADIVHHAIFFRISPGQVAEAKALDQRTPGAGWQCFGGSGLKGGSPWVAHWAPGANEVLLGPNLGHPMPPGSLLVMQVHYNLLSTGGRAGQADQSAIRLRLADHSAAMRPLETILVPGQVELPCTARESGPLCERSAAVADVIRRFGNELGTTVANLSRMCHPGKPPTPGPTQHCDRPVDKPATIYAAAGHMHLLGRSIRVDLNPGTPGARTVLDVPAYDFDDQATRPLATPITVKRGDVLRVTCTHDAGLREKLPQTRSLPPRYVVWGDGTSDEMCLGLVLATRP